MTSLPAPLSAYFAARGWTLHPHQLSMLARAQEASTLLIAPTGGGKTLAGFLPTLAELGAAPLPGLHTLYISPLKALTAESAVVAIAASDIAEGKPMSGVDADRVCVAAGRIATALGAVHG